MLLSKQPIKQTVDEDEVAVPHPLQRAAQSWKRGTARYGEWASEGERNADFSAYASRSWTLRDQMSPYVSTG